MLDDKDLEIARLKGKVEALEGELAKERAARHVAWSAGPAVCMHVARDATGRCMECGLVLPKITTYEWTTIGGPDPAGLVYTNWNVGNAAACHPLPFPGMTIWNGPRTPGGATS